jgi:ATP-dependent Lon protease
MATKETVELDTLDQRLADTFPGQVVRKDLVHTVKGGFNVPVYVLEYLLGKYCSSTEPDIIAEGLAFVRETLSNAFVRADESEKLKSLTREQGTHRIIDKVRVRLVETEDKYWAGLTNMGLENVHIHDQEVKRFDRLLGGGIWAIIDLGYDPALQHRGMNRPFIVQSLKPIQNPSSNLDVFYAGRTRFSRDEWMDVLLRSLGIEARHPDFSPRKKLLMLMRLIPLVEANYNLIELGPRGTGKSFVYREISPYAILVSGGQTTVPMLFMNLATGRIGMVGLWDVVAFDEVAGIRFKDSSAIQILKDYMESGSFSRGKEEIPANASIVFNGNIDGDIKTLVRTSHLLTPLPEDMQDLALIDRIHAYLPGWDTDKLRPEFFTQHYGLVVDYFSEVLRAQRKLSYTEIPDRFFRMGNHLNQRDVRAVRKTISGLIKLLHPDGNVAKEELEEYLVLAMEMRRRVKEQLRKMGGFEYWAINFSYIDQETMQERFVPVPEESGEGLISSGPLAPGVAYGITSDANESKLAIMRLEVQALRGNGNIRLSGIPRGSTAIKEAIRTAHDYLKANPRATVGGKGIADYDLSIQIINPMGAQEGIGIGVASLIAMLSALTGRSVSERTVILGTMSIHGTLFKVSMLTEHLQMAMDNGAVRVLLPSENKRDFADIPSEILDKLQMSFYSDPLNAAYRALGME